MRSMGRLALAGLLAATMAVVGCAPQIVGPHRPESRTSGATDAPQPTEEQGSPSPEPAERRAPADLSFESGGALDPTQWRVQWFTFGEGFSELEPDDGNGNWAIVDDSTGCEIRFFQGTIGGMDLAQNDRELTDDLLWIFTEASVAGAVREDVTTHAFDDSVPLFLDDDALPMRTIWWSSDDGATELYSARMFASLGGGVYVGIHCPPGQDASAEFDKLRDGDFLRVDVGPGSS